MVQRRHRRRRLRLVVPDFTFKCWALVTLIFIATGFNLRHNPSNFFSITLTTEKTFQDWVQALAPPLTSGKEETAWHKNTSSQQATPIEEPPFVCLNGFWGDNANRLIQLSHLFYRTNGTYRGVGLSRRWSVWYLEWFDKTQMPEVKWYTRKNSFWRDCTNKTISAETAHYAREKGPNFNPILAAQIQPKASIKEEAQRAIEEHVANHAKKHSLNKHFTIITVHRRSFGKDNCTTVATSGRAFYCVSGETHHDNWTIPELLRYCEFSYPDLLKDLRQRYGIIELDASSIVPILLTDGYSPDVDQTFPQIDNHSFPVQMWMMVLSNIHYGYPMSSVDYVVSHWRRDYHRNDENAVRPERCFRFQNASS